MAAGHVAEHDVGVRSVVLKALIAWVQVLVGVCVRGCRLSLKGLLAEVDGPPAGVKRLHGVSCYVHVFQGHESVHAVSQRLAIAAFADYFGVVYLAERLKDLTQLVLSEV